MGRPVDEAELHTQNAKCVVVYYTKQVYYDYCHYKHVTFCKCFSIGTFDTLVDIFSLVYIIIC